MKINLIPITLILLLFTNNLSAKVKLPSVFSNGMVLQQQSNVLIWGKATPAVNMTIVTSWDKKRYTLKSTADGTWETKMSTPIAGGPYTITINDGTNLVLSDILIGEVWIASGQSNMEMPLKGFINQPVLNADETIAQSNNPQIRLFQVKKVSWAMPLDDCSGTWETAKPASVTTFSAVAYGYAKILQEKLKVPVGIIQVAWGGTRIESWMTVNSLKSFPDLWVPPVENKALKSKNTPSGLYNGMVNPLVGYGIKGVIWYQGETNRKNWYEYSKLLPTMVKEWRTIWNIGDWDFYYVQIAPYDKPTDKSYAFFPLVREAQLKALDDIPNSGMAVLTDVGAQNTVHPSDKESVSKRLSYLALAKSYGFKDIKWSGPVYKNMKINDDKVILFFDLADGLYFKNQESTNFEIAGNNKVFYPATAKIKGSEISVFSDKVKKPVAVRYAFKAWVKGDLFNGIGLPASSFRTDNWKMK
ncbi:sialate O-acetylesterase [Pedobacter arcticus]|uniref:sialate O-acetylesterase n=1 Tax=Pedobacter arcticus TaxID=752140 RepID=UPI0004751080|nr:sialate O-acetylesterase [Pedobacter arcticus]